MSMQPSFVLQMALMFLHHSGSLVVLLLWRHIWFLGTPRSPIIVFMFWSCPCFGVLFNVWMPLEISLQWLCLKLSFQCVPLPTDVSSEFWCRLPHFFCSHNQARVITMCLKLILDSHFPQHWHSQWQPQLLCHATCLWSKGTWFGSARLSSQFNHCIYVICCDCSEWAQFFIISTIRACAQFCIVPHHL